MYNLWKHEHMTQKVVHLGTELRWWWYEFSCWESFSYPTNSQRGQPGPEVLSECNLPTLAWRRRVHCLCLLYILYKGQGPPSLSELLPATVQARTEIVLRSSHSFRFPFASSRRHLSSFLCFSIRLWNTLPASAISQSSSVSSFRSFLHSFYKADKFSLGL